MNPLLNAFRQIATLSPKAEKELMHIAKVKKYPKGEILLNAGEISNYIYFVEKGVTRVYYFRDKREITYWLANEHEFAGSFCSFFSRTPSSNFIQALEDSTLWAFNHDELETIYSKSKEIEVFGRKLYAYGLMILEKKFEDFHSLTAPEKYEVLLRKHPHLLNTIPLHIIASYMGVTKETLSRIRSGNTSLEK